MQLLYVAGISHGRYRLWARKMQTLEGQKVLFCVTANFLADRGELIGCLHWISMS